MSSSSRRNLEFRRITAYDKAAARVRSDGLRTFGFDPQASKAKINADFKRHHIKRALKTSRKGKNWIAGDVYQFERIPKRRRIVVEETDDDDDGGGEDDDYSDSEFSLAEKPISRRGKQESEHFRTKLRRFQTQDLSFLSASSNNADATAEDLDPSSDLLKSIHYHVAQFYAVSAQLVNCGREYRLSRKARSEGLERPDDSASGGDDDEEEEEDGEDGDGDKNEDEDEAVSKDGEEEGISGSSSKSDSSYQDQGDDDDSHSDPMSTDRTDNEDVFSAPPISKLRARMQRMNDKYDRNYHEKRDMYNAFDGSVLFCIGMLVKAHVISQLQARVPENWDDEVAAYERFEEELADVSESDEDLETEESSRVETDLQEDASLTQSKRDNDDVSVSILEDEIDDTPPRQRKRKRKRKRKRQDDLRTNYVSAVYS